jgi:hypothetical protein
MSYENMLGMAKSNGDGPDGHDNHDSQANDTNEATETTTTETTTQTTEVKTVKTVKPTESKLEEAENQSSDFAFTVMLQGYVVAASNLNDGSIMPTLKASFYASGDWKPGLK